MSKNQEISIIEETAVVFTKHANGIPVWNTPEGVVMGLKKEHFINDETHDVTSEARKEFYLYMVEFKTFRSNMFYERAKSLSADAEEYKAKAAGVGKKLNPKEIAEAKVAKLMKQLEASKAMLADINS